MQSDELKAISEVLDVLNNNLNHIAVVFPIMVLDEYDANLGEIYFDEGVYVFHQPERTGQ